MHGKTPAGRIRRRGKPFDRRPNTGGARPTQRPAPKRRGPVGDPRLVYRRDPSAFDSRHDTRAIMGDAPACAIKDACKACKYVNCDYKASLEAKYQEGLSLLRKTGVLDIAHILPVVESARPLKYRAYFKMAVRALSNLSQPGLEVDIPPRPDSSQPGPATPDTPESLPRRFAIGLFTPGTHDVIDMDDCPLHVPVLKRLIKDLREELELSTITPYDETSGIGELRYVAARSAHLTGEIMLTFVVTRAIKPELRTLMQRLLRRGHKINSTHMNINSEPGNAIFGSETQRIGGSDRLRERLCDLDFEIGPTSFFQINPWQAINLYRRIEMIAGQAQSSSASAVAWDLYCGTGQISLLLARQGYRVLGIEENPLAISDAVANARKNRLENQAAFIASKVEESDTRIPGWANNPALIVVNPSRRGLAESTRAHLTWLLTQNPTTRFAYVSCNVETLARDLKYLCQSGFVVRQIEAFDMFAQTDGLEWLVVLTR